MLREEHGSETSRPTNHANVMISCQIKKSAPRGEWKWNFSTNQPNGHTERVMWNFRSPKNTRRHNDQEWLRRQINDICICIWWICIGLLFTFQCNVQGVLRFHGSIFTYICIIHDPLRLAKLELMDSNN